VSRERRWDVLAVGDADVDLYLRVSRLPQRDEKVIGSLLGEFPGGISANFACAASQLGMRAGLIAVVGDDRYGEIALQSLRDAGVATELVVVRQGGRTFFCVVMLDDSGEKALTLVVTECIAPQREDINPESLGETRLVHLIANDVDDTTWVAREAKQRGALVSLDIEPTTTIDASPHGFRTLLSHVDLAFPNAAGLRSLVGGDEIEGAREILRFGPRIVVVTLGAQGCLIVTGDETIRLPGFAVPVADTTGAGDCFIAAFVSGYLNGWGLRRCGTVATAAAAISVTAIGSQSAQPTLAQIEAFVAERAATSAR
jgi:sugar/nucleoside kinase (ribokinase family)